MKRVSLEIQKSKGSNFFEEMRIMSVQKGITCEEGANVTSIRIGNKNVSFNIFLNARTANRREICLSKRLYFLC